MKNKVNTKVLMTVASVALIVCMAVGGVAYALLSLKSDGATNTFKQAKIDISVEEEKDESFTQKKSVTVKNNGNTGAYVRVKLVSYWAGKDKDGSYAAIGKESIPVDQSCLNLTDWFYDSENDTYYCIAPVAGGAESPDLIGEDTPIQMTIDEFGNRQVIEVLAQAVQATPSEAVVEVWNVTLDDAGNITGLN